MAKKKISKQKATKPPQQRSRVPTWIWLAGGGVLAVLLVGGLFYLGTMQSPALTSEIEGVVFYLI